MYKSILTSISIIGTSIGLAACVTRADVEEIKQSQRDIVSKLDALQKTAARPAPRARVTAPDPSKTYAFPVGGSAIKGNEDAWVTVVEVSDFQCPYCKRVGPVLAQLEDKYGDDVRFIFKLRSPAVPPTSALYGPPDATPPSPVDPIWIASLGVELEWCTGSRKQPGHRREMFEPPR